MENEGEKRRFHFSLGEEELNLQVFENPPSCGNDQRCKRKKKCNFWQEKWPIKFPSLQRFLFFMAKKLTIFSFFYGQRARLACTAHSVHTQSRAKMEVPPFILQSAASLNSAFVARRRFAESKHMRNVHVICSMNRRPSCMALTELNNVNKNNTRCLSGAHLCHFLFFPV